MGNHALAVEEGHIALERLKEVIEMPTIRQLREVEEGHIALERLKEQVCRSKYSNFCVEEGHIALERLKAALSYGQVKAAATWKKATSRLSD